jgi:hypothetical protein
LDSKRIIYLQGLEFLDSYDNFNLCFTGEASAENRLKTLRRFLILLESSTNKGFITTTDLTKFPVFAEMLPLFFDCEESYLSLENSMVSYQ